MISDDVAGVVFFERILPCSFDADEGCDFGDFGMNEAKVINSDEVGRRIVSVAFELLLLFSVVAFGLTSGVLREAAFGDVIDSLLDIIESAYTIGSCNTFIGKRTEREKRFRITT